MLITLALMCFVVNGMLAARKGYYSVPWAFLGGPAGLIILALLPEANNPDLFPVEQQRLRKRGVWVAIVAMLCNVGILRFYLRLI